MNWFIIILILAAAFGPIAYLMPSARDKALTGLRAAARAAGLEVEITQLPKLAAEAHERVSAGGIARTPILEGVGYLWRFRTRPAADLRWRVLRAPTDEFAVAPGWELDRSFAEATTPPPTTDYWKILYDIAGDLPADTVGLAVSQAGCLCYWQEQIAEQDPVALVQQISQVLERIAAHHEGWVAETTPP